MTSSVRGAVSCGMAGLLTAAAPVARAAVVLVERGAPGGAIVLDADASPSERWAAEELQAHLRTMSGAELPIRESGDGVVYLGRAAVEAGLVGDLDGLGDEGFVLRTRDGALGIAGSPVRGTMYGVFTLLSDLGCRWWTPTEQTIPTRETVAVGPLDRRETPQLEYRDMMVHEMWGEAGQVWAARNRVNGMAWQDAPARFGGRYRFIGNLVHSYNQLMRESGHELTPEMWALVDGQRRPSSQPCLTHPATLEAMTVSVIRRFEDNPDAQFVVVGQNDNRNYCRCENCAAVAEREDSQAGHVIAFANRLLERVRETIPAARIATPAYQWSRRPPRHVRPHEDMIIVLCSIEADFNRPLAEGSTEANRAFQSDVEGWHAIAGTLFVWDYTTNFRHFLMPFPNLDALVPNVRYFAEQGAGGYFAQGAHTGGGSEFFGLRMWMLARALWDPQADADALLAEFLEGYYGPAADAVRDAIDIMHRPGREDPAMRMGIYLAMDRPWVMPAPVAEAAAALQRAEEQAGGEDSPWAARVRHARMPIDYVLAKRGPESATWAAVDAALGPLTMADVAGRLLRVAEERGIGQLAEGHAAGPWREWLADYARRTAADGPPRPPEAPAEARHVIQAGHMDPHFSRGEWLEQADGASDGWAIRSPTHAWLVRHALVESEDFEPGATVRLMARIRGQGVVEAAGGTLANVGVHGAGASHSRPLGAALLRDGRWHVVEVATWRPAPGQGVWMALTAEADRNNLIEAVQLDCIWLEPVP